MVQATEMWATWAHDRQRHLMWPNLYQTWTLQGFENDRRCRLAILAILV